MGPNKKVEIMCQTAYVQMYNGNRFKVVQKIFIKHEYYRLYQISSSSVVRTTSTYLSNLFISHFSSGALQEKLQYDFF